MAVEHLLMTSCCIGWMEVTWECTSSSGLRCLSALKKRRWLNNKHVYNSYSRQRHATVLLWVVTFTFSWHVDMIISTFDNTTVDSCDDYLLVGEGDGAISTVTLRHLLFAMTFYNRYCYMAVTFLYAIYLICHLLLPPLPHIGLSPDHLQRWHRNQCGQCNARETATMDAECYWGLTLVSYFQKYETVCTLLVSAFLFVGVLVIMHHWHSWCDVV